MVPLVADAGFAWMATDEGILARTMGRGFTRNAEGHLDQPELLYRPYRVGAADRGVACGFRDHTLSDLIGFSYASWSAGGAAGDFVHRLVEGGRRYARNTGGGEATIFVILDGENAWEHYDGQGRPFLRALYSALAAQPELRTVTMGEACAGASELLPSIFPGSWIDSDFYIWIGHPDDHRAWTQLVDARKALDAAPPGLPAASLARARDEMFIAEGSDWFWWYGDDHSSEHDLEFDDLFRRHVRNIYRALEKPIPEELFVSNITTQPPTVQIYPPTGFIHPVIDGEVTNYFEWIGAGSCDIESSVGAMHRVSDPMPAVAAIEFGFDAQHLFIRIDGTLPMREMLAAVDLSVNFLQPVGVRVLVHLDGQGATAALLERGSAAPRDCPGLAVSVALVAELRVSFACLKVDPRAPVAFFVAVNRDGTEVEHHPRHRPIEVTVPGPEFRVWTA
jgi:hypothetical protein